jgi:hypothetical protein
LDEIGDQAGHPGDRKDDFARTFEAALARLQVRVESACAAKRDWPEQVAAGIRAALEFAAAEPAAADALTNGALAHGHAGFARYDRMIAHFGERLLPGRALRPENARLPEITERAMTGGLATLIAQRLDHGGTDDLPALAPEAIQFVLTPYLGSAAAARIATPGDSRLS